MVPVTQFFPRLIPQVLGCPEPFAAQAVVDAAIEFCEKSLCVQATLDAAPVTAGVSQYEFDLPTQTALVQVLSAICGTRSLVPVPSTSVTTAPSLSGTPQYFYTRDVDEVLTAFLFPTPDKSDPLGLTFRVALRPTRVATQLHSSLFDQWADAIVDGAAARIMATAGQPFTNEAKAVVLMQKFRGQVNAARLEALRGRVVSSMSVKMRSF